MIKNKIILILLVLVSLFLYSACSQEIVVTLPEGADWNFYYYDSSGVFLGDGVAEVKFNEYSENTAIFSIKLTESAFGDTALFIGYVELAEREKDMLPFRAVGKWFLGELFYIEGDFNTELNKIYFGSVAYSLDIIENLSKILEDYTLYRSEKKTFDNDNSSMEEPALPLYDNVIDNLFIWNSEMVSRVFF